MVFFVLFFVFEKSSPDSLDNTFLTKGFTRQNQSQNPSFGFLIGLKMQYPQQAIKGWISERYLQ